MPHLHVLTPFRSRYAGRAPAGIGESVVYPWVRPAAEAGPTTAQHESHAWLYGCPPALPAWESHKVGVLTESDAGHVGHERPGLPPLVSGLWPADGPTTTALQSVLRRIGWCRGTLLAAGLCRSAIVGHHGGLPGAGWLAAFSLPRHRPLLYKDRARCQRRISSTTDVHVWSVGTTSPPPLVGWVGCTYGGCTRPCCLGHPTRRAGGRRGVSPWKRLRACSGIATLVSAIVAQWRPWYLGASSIGHSALNVPTPYPSARCTRSWFVYERKERQMRGTQPFQGLLSGQQSLRWLEQLGIS
jgi:hypothetical protein